MTQPLRKSGILLTTILRGCEGKRRYSDEYAARGAGQIFEAEKGIKLYFYPCSICRGFHLTKHPQRKDSHAVAWEYPRTRRGQ